MNANLPTFGNPKDAKRGMSRVAKSVFVGGSPLGDPPEARSAAISRGHFPARIKIKDCEAHRG